MSKGWLIQSTGEPYFGFYQDAVEPAGRGYGGSEFSLELDIAIDAKPIVATSEDEEHPLFSLFQWPGTGADLFTLGVTPSGRLYGRGPGSNFVQTETGLLTFDGVRLQLRLLYNLGSAIEVQAVDVGGATAAADGTVVEAAANKIPRWSLLNGASGLSAVPCRLYSAAFRDENTPILWHVNDGGALDIGAEWDDSDQGPADKTLTAQFYLPSFGYPRSRGETIPSTQVSHAFRWRPNTEWQKVARTKTAWARV